MKMRIYNIINKKNIIKKRLKIGIKPLLQYNICFSYYLIIPTIFNLRRKI